MMGLRRFAAFTVVLLSACVDPAIWITDPPLADARNTATPTPQTGRPSAWVEKSLDIVIKDKRGRPLRNVNPGDLQILEDGKAVHITSLQAATGNALGAKGDGGRLCFISMLLNGDSDLSHSLASEALAELSKAADSANIYVAIWEVRDRFALVHNFTHDLKSLRVALSGKQSIEASVNNPENPVAAARAAARQAREIAAQLIGQQHQRPALAALLALARAEKPLTGRKMLLFFSDGTQLTAATNDALKLVVSDANQSEVSVYSADVSGLSSRAAERAAQTLVDTSRTNATTAQTAQYANSSTLLRSESAAAGVSGHSRLQLLSWETGGSYTDASGGIHKFVRAALRDTQTFYLVSYQQSIEKADVHFRTLAVRANRKGLQIQSRAGAFPSLLLAGKELSGFEIPLLAALSAPTRTETIWFSAAAFPDPQKSAPPLTNLVLQVPLNGLIAHELDQTRRFRFQVSILALLKDGDGQIVDKISRDVALEGALEGLTRARSDQYSFDAPFTVAPKGCHVDIAIRDQFASKISTKSVDCSDSRPATLTAITGNPAHATYMESGANDDETALLNTIVPAKLLKNSSRPGDQEMQALIKGARERVLDYKQGLPNFVCMMVTRRSSASVAHVIWRPIDSSSYLLTYVAGKETTVLLDLNGHTANAAASADDEGADVSGEFGDLLAMPFEEKANAKIDWEGEAQIMGKRTQVFRLTVSRLHSTYLLKNNGAGRSMFAAYHALAYIDVDTLAVRRLSVVADDLPAAAFIRECQLTVDYDYLPVSGNEFLLPVHATLIVRRHGSALNRNEIDFQNYRKYGSESRLVATQ